MRSSLRNNGLSSAAKERSFNPMEGVGNMADCMLVLACGLMLSLIVSWNLDLAVDQPLEEDSPLSVVEQLEQSEQQIDEAACYEQLGVVYRDPSSGELYMVTDPQRE